MRKCCCTCEQVGAMCICDDSQEYNPGCYENVTAQEAEEADGIWMGAGSTCSDGSACPDCCVGNDLDRYALKKCCYPRKISTGCNEYTIDECEDLVAEITTRCECELKAGTWDSDDCECLKDNPGCDGCCPGTTISGGVPGNEMVTVIVTTINRNRYTITWECIDCGPGTTTTDYYLSTQARYDMTASHYTSTFAPAYPQETNFDCSSFEECGNGQENCYTDAHFSETKTITGIYYSDASNGCAKLSGLDPNNLCNGIPLNIVYWKNESGRYSCVSSATSNRTEHAISFECSGENIVP